MNPLQIDIHAEGAERSAYFLAMSDFSGGRLANLVLFLELRAWTLRHPAASYSMTWSTGAGAGGFDFAGDLAAAIERCADELSGPGAMSNPPAFGDPAEEDAARYWIGRLQDGRELHAAGWTVETLDNPRDRAQQSEVNRWASERCDHAHTHAAELHAPASSVPFLPGRSYPLPGWTEAATI